MEKRCFLVGKRDSLFKQLVASLLIDLTDGFVLYENKALEMENLLREIDHVRPDMILLEDMSPYSEGSLLSRLLFKTSDIPLIVISEDSNVMHVVRRESRLLSSSSDLIKTIHLVAE